MTRLKTKLQDIQRKLRTAEEIQIYNDIVASTSTKEIDNRIALLTDTANDLNNTVLNGIDLPLEDIIRYEAEYKSTVAELNTLLGARDSYTMEPIPTPDGDLATLQHTASKLENSIAQSGEYEEIGNIDYYPVKGQVYHVNSPFGSRYDPVGIRGNSFHYGVDLKSPSGTPIGAWFSGTVTKAGYSSGSGNYVWLNHGCGVKSFYCHLKRIDVTVGQHVTQGTQIALSGNTGKFTTGPHLHLGLYIDGTAVDPRVVLE